MTDATIPVSAETVNRSAQHPFAALLRDYGLLQVAIVDDYYDPPEYLELSTRDADDLWGLLQFDDEALAELRGLGHAVTGPADLTSSLLAMFLAKREQLPKFNALWWRSIAGQRREEQGKQLTLIEEHLKRDLGLAVSNFGSNEPIKDIARDGAQLLLLDWRLGEDGEAAIEAAVQKARQIHEQWPIGQTRPLIVLMSSDPNVTSHAEEFRRRSRLLAGMFHVAAKHDLTDQFSLQMHLHTLAMSLPAGHLVQTFVEALREKVKAVGDDFIERIGALTLSDYAYIQSLSLQADGQPLGDYLMWLFSTYFGHLLFGRALQQQRNNLDTLTFTPLPSQAVPSPQLAEMYLHALFDVDVGPVAPHPRGQPAPVGVTHGRGTSAPEAAAVDEQRLMLSLGDILAPVSETLPATGRVDAGAVPQIPVSTDAAGADSKGEASRLPDLWMIINAQCDLAFTPEPEGTRSIDSGRSILLLPGTLQLVREPIPERYKDAPHTELYEDGGRSYRIFWNTKEVKSIPYGDFRRWLDGADASTGASARYKRKARLRLPFALEVQRAFAADLTRVGMPVAPPIYQAVDIRLLSVTDKRFDQSEELEESEVAFLVLSRDESKIVQRCVLTMPLVQHLKGMLEARLAMQEAQLREPTEDKKLQTQLQLKVDALRRAVDDHSAWAKLLSPIDMPTATKARPFLSEYIQIVYNKSVGDDCSTSKVIAAVSLQEEHG